MRGKGLPVIKEFALAAAAAAALIAPASASAELSKADQKDLISVFQDVNAVCRGYRNPSTETACQAREKVGRILGRNGLCFGKRGQAGYQMSWHRCGKDSVRPRDSGN